MKRLFEKYYNSELSSEEFSEAVDFLGNKNNEKIIYKQMEPLWEKEMEASVANTKDNPALFRRIQETISQEKHRLTKRKLERYTWGLRIAAVFVVALIVSNLFFFQKSGNNKYANQLQTISTPYGAKTNITLPDGSLVWLNSGSTLSYPLHFGIQRPITLEGEAFFEVVKSRKPFVVSTVYGNVEVKGTSFNVNAFSEDNAFQTTLVEGVVVFKNTNTLDEVTLNPNEQIEKTLDGFQVKQVETKYFTSWKEGKLLFNKEPFPSFIKKLERWYNVKIEYSGKDLHEMWYTGTIEMESISEVMEMISKAAPVTYSFNNKTRVFTIKKILKKTKTEP